MTTPIASLSRRHLLARGLLSGATLAALAGAIALPLALATPATAQPQPHWLVGAWKGTMGNVIVNSRYGSDRSLVIAKVSSDGSSAKAKWTGDGDGTTVTLSIVGDTISFTTPGNYGASYRLTHKGDTLEGSWQRSGSGKTGPVSLKKQ